MLPTWCPVRCVTWATTARCWNWASRCRCTASLRLAFDLPIARYQARDVYARVVTLNTTGPQVLAGVEFTATSAEFDAQVRRFVQGMVVSG